MYWRDAGGKVQSGTRVEFRAAAAAGTVGEATPVFDTTVTTAGDWRARFERPLADAWHAQVAGRTAGVVGG